MAQAKSLLDDHPLDDHPLYEATIGIEVHVQLNTKSKIFCSCQNEITEQPNSNICEVCVGYPGSLPVLNKKVIESAILAGLATHCSITPISFFARKHYFYPDLPKNYQITQDDQPICIEGYVTIRLADNSLKKIRIIRIHIEEDAGKNIHITGSNESLVNLNRAGTPLLEIVSYPDITNAYEAKAYLKALHTLIQCLGIGSGSMEEGAFRADTNISIKRKKDTKLGTRCELKNINSFKFISDAINYEIERQITLLDAKKLVKQETRLWDTKHKKTILMRSKEEAADYRFFQDPDLPLIEIEPSLIKRMKQQMPELPSQKFERLLDCGITVYEAEILIDNPELANYYTKVYSITKSSLLINWILRDLMGYLKEHKISLDMCKVSPKKLAELIGLLEKGTINNRTAQELFESIATTGKSATLLVKERGLEQVDSVETLEKIILEIIDKNSKQVRQYQAGKEKIFGFFVGQTMKQTKGQGNPNLIQRLLKKHLHN